MKMKNVFCCKVSPDDFEVRSGVVCEHADDGVTAHEAVADAVNNYDAIIDVLGHFIDGESSHDLVGITGMSEEWCQSAINLYDKLKGEK